MQNEGELVIPSREGVSEWLRGIADAIDKGSLGNVNRGIFIGLDRGDSGFSYRPLRFNIFMDSDEMVALLEITKNATISEIFGGPV